MMKNYGAFNLRHLAKGLKYNNLKPEELGITANQVKVLKSWLKTTGLKDGKKLTPLGNLIKQHDKFIEEEVTMQILHYQIYKNSEAVFKYVFYNSEFNKDVLIKDLADVYDFKTNLIVADFNTLLNMYMPKELEKENPMPMLLPLIKRQGDLYYKKEYKPNIWIVLAIFIDNLPEPTLENNISALDLKEAYIQLKNIFGLEFRTMEDILYKLTSMHQIQIKNNCIEILTDNTFFDCIEKVYEEMEK